MTTPALEPVVARTSYADLPSTLTTELRAAGLNPEDLYGAVARAISEDVPGTDATSVATIPVDLIGTADLVARRPGTVAGLAVAELVLRYVVDADVTVERHVADGDRVEAGAKLLSVSGPVLRLLVAERTTLNYLGRLSGIATETARWVDAVAGTAARVRDTRKTTPGWRDLEKYAVRCGGGANHRRSLSDQALVKDNHVLGAGGVVAAYLAVRERYAGQQPPLPIQVEVDSLDQLREVLDAGADEVLLDNMSPEEVAEAVALTAGRARLEASGGLDLEVAAAYARAGVDFLAVGALTHSARVLDIGMDLRSRTPAGARDG